MQLDRATHSWVVLWHQAAVVEYERIREGRSRKAILRAASLLRELGPALTEPHGKKVRGTSKLWELRPAGGKVLLRPLYVQAARGTFVIVAIAPEAVVDPPGFAAAVTRAQGRARALQAGRV